MSSNPAPVFEVVPPAANTAEAWNEAVAEGAKKAGVPIEEQTQSGQPRDAEGRFVKTTESKDDAKPVTTMITIGGKEVEFTGKDSDDVLKQVTAALTGAQLAQPPQQTATAEKKDDATTGALSDEEKLRITLGIQTGDLSVLDDYMEKSGLMSRFLEKQGISLEALKASVTSNQAKSLNDQWKDATDAFGVKVKAGEIDYPGGEQNTQMMGLMIAKLGLGKTPAVESFVKAYEEMKKMNMVFPGGAAAQNAQVTTRQAASSTAIGAAATHEVRPQMDPNRRFELDMTKMSPHQWKEAWNGLIAQGVKPEQIIIIQ